MLTTTVFGVVSFLTFTVFKHSVITCNDIKVIKKRAFPRWLFTCEKFRRWACLGSSPWASPTWRLASPPRRTSNSPATRDRLTHTVSQRSYPPFTLCGSSRGSVSFYDRRVSREIANILWRPRRNRIDRNEIVNLTLPSAKQPQPSAYKTISKTTENLGLNRISGKVV